MRVNVYKTAVLAYLLFICLTVSGCFLTKVVTVPMRVTGAVFSVLPVAGNTVHDGIDQAADTIDDVPL